MTLHALRFTCALSTMNQPGLILWESGWVQHDMFANVHVLIWATENQPGLILWESGWVRHDLVYFLTSLREPVTTTCHMLLYYGPAGFNPLGKQLCPTHLIAWHVYTLVAKMFTLPLLCCLEQPNSGCGCFVPTRPPCTKVELTVQWEFVIKCFFKITRSKAPVQYEGRAE